VHIEEINDKNTAKESQLNSYVNRHQRQGRRPGPMDDMDATPYWTNVNENIFDNSDPSTPTYIRRASTRKEKITNRDWIKMVSVSSVVALAAVLAFAPVENLNKPLFLKKILQKAVVPYQSLYKWGFLGLIAAVVMT
jgi:hypothetical protein